ncbi:phosphomannomutase [Catenovulum sediminis]|uniref:phosphomannomutase n=1 Tax=Catenovulum sediminis TaxID=1740262 RepID=A0ABV1RCE7_9ALTE
MQSIDCFKTYDVRGKVPQQLNTLIAYEIGRAYASELAAKKVAVGHDIRLTGPEITEALIKGLNDQGCDVVHIGQCGTEEIYFAAQTLDIDGGICVTASHNPKEYNGMKFVKKNAQPITETQLANIKYLAESRTYPTVSKKGNVEYISIAENYKAHLLSYINIEVLKPLKVVVNAGNGGAGAIIDLLEDALPFEFIKLQHDANGHFPQGVPNPLLPENRQITAQAVIDHKANLGIAWDGDFDRCFFFDETGNFVEGYYMVALLAAAMLEKQPKQNIVYDPRLYWNTLEVVKNSGGQAHVSKTGHAFIKQTMREKDALYGGEMSAHHYFRDFAYCDNGNIPWLILVEYLSQSDRSLSQLVAQQQAEFPCSGERNFKVSDVQNVLDKISRCYQQQAIKVDTIDGISMEFENWRFNVRASNTEPLLRLNVETRADAELLKQKTAELAAVIEDK